MRYIGSKIQLLNDIEDVINKNTDNNIVFCDIFSGTASVAKYFKSKYKIISNDFLYFSYVLQYATIKINTKPTFRKINDFLKMNVFEYLNNVKESAITVNDSYFIYYNYSPAGNRYYLTKENAKLVDFWRHSINDWKRKQLLTSDEYIYLLACIIDAVPFYSNISGTYGAFLKTWDKRAIKTIKLNELDVESGLYENEVYNCDSELLVSSISGDILYIDPPYNERQYLPNYHLLETIAKYDFPKIKGVTGIREYSKQKSNFCIKSKVYQSLESMIQKSNFKSIILSYSTDGLMTEEKIIEIMKKYSYNVKVYRFPYKRFKSRKLKNTSDLYELIFFMEKKNENIL